MPCTRCPHCRALSNPAALTLSGPPQHTSTAGANLEFYREFGLAYGRARQLRLRPRQSLMAANPWMTASQCSTYLKRARELGMIQVPTRGRADRQMTPPVTTPAPTAEVTTPTPTPQRPVAGRGKGRARRALDWTPEQSGDVFFHEDVELRMENQRLRGQLFGPDELQRAYAESGGKLTDAQARAVLDWAVASGYAAREPDGVSVRVIVSDD